VCPYCGNCILVFKTRKLAIAKDAFEASEQLRILKAQRQKNAKKPTHNKAK
jgi:hypothetical protein